MRQPSQLRPRLCMAMVNSSVVVSASCSLSVYAYDSANLSSLQSEFSSFCFGERP